MHSKGKAFPSSPACPLTQPGKLCCPLCKVLVPGPWHMAHESSPSWEINYSSKRKTKHFTNCPERKKLGNRAGIRLDTSNIHEKKEGKRGRKVLSAVIKVWLGLDLGMSLCWFIPRAQHSLQGLRLQQDNHIRMLHLCPDSTFVLQSSYPLPQVLQTSYPLPGSGKCRCGAVGRACSPTPMGPAPHTTRACSTSIFPHAAAASTWSRIPLPSLQLQD